MKIINNQYDTILEALADLNEKGYRQNFSLTPSGLYCPITKQYFNPDELKIMSFHRFEGASDMDDMAILYVIEAKGGCNGVVIDAYGTYGNSDLGAFLKQIPNTE